MLLHPARGRVSRLFWSLIEPERSKQLRCDYFAIPMRWFGPNDTQISSIDIKKIMAIEWPQLTSRNTKNCAPDVHGNWMRQLWFEHATASQVKQDLTHNYQQRRGPSHATTQVQHVSATETQTQTHTHTHRQHTKKQTKRKHVPHTNTKQTQNTKQKAKPKTTHNINNRKQKNDMRRKTRVFEHKTNVLIDTLSNPQSQETHCCWTKHIVFPNKKEHMQSVTNINKCANRQRTSRTFSTNINATHTNHNVRETVTCHVRRNNELNKKPTLRHKHPQPQRNTVVENTLLLQSKRNTPSQTSTNV